MGTPRDATELAIIDALTVAYQYTRKNPTFVDTWGQLRTTTTPPEGYPSLPTGSLLNLEGEAEFWYNYGKYEGLLSGYVEEGESAPRSYGEIIEDIYEGDENDPEYLPQP